LPTSGIHYLSAAGSAAAIPETLQPWIPFFCYAFSKIGTKRFDYTQIARRIDAATGGIGLSAQARIVYDQTGKCLPLVQLNAKCLTRNIDPMYAIIEELIGEIAFSNLPRLKQLLGEYRTGLESMIIQNGHRLAISLSSRSFSAAGFLSELWGGIHQVKAIKNFSDQMDDQALQQLADQLTAIAQTLFTPDNLIMTTIGEPDAIDAASARIADSAVLAKFTRADQSADFAPHTAKIDPAMMREGWHTTSAVAFVAQTLPTVSLGHSDAPVLAVISKLLRSLYLHREIREKGGAYGGFALYNPETGLFSLASYRDPHIAQTLKVYDGVPEFLNSASFSGEDIKEAVLQVCSEIDKPDPPGPGARKAFWRMIVKLQDEQRLAYKQELLQITKDRVLTVAERYFTNIQANSGVAVIAGKEQLEHANTQLKNNTLEIKAI